MKPREKPILLYLLHEQVPPGKSTTVATKLYGDIRLHYWIMHPDDLPLFEKVYTCRRLQDALEQIRSAAWSMIQGAEPGSWLYQQSLKEARLEE
jgi:hypothetical protein